MDVPDPDAGPDNRQPAVATRISESRPNTSKEPADTADDAFLASWRLVAVIGSLCLGILLFGLDINIIGTAIPQITTEFGSLASVSWYGSAYLLTLTAFQPLFGNLYKYFNAKVVFLVSLVLFEVGSVVCATAPRSEILIFGRAFLGFGAAGLLQGALAIIGYVVRLDRVPLFQGIVISSFGVSVCIGPVIGGALTQYATWRWCFWINIPVGFCSIVVVLLCVPLEQSSNKTNRSLSLANKLRHIDVIGTILFIGAICSLLLVLTWGGTTYAWSDPRCIGLFVSFGFLTSSFSYWMWRKKELAFIPLRVLGQRSICMGTLAIFGIGLASQVYAYYLPVFFQSAQGVSTTESGARFIALVAPQIVSLVVVGALVSKWGHYVPFMISGIVIAAVGAGLLTTLDTTTPAAQWAAFLVITGIGIGMAQQLPYTAVQAVLDAEDVATGNAITVFSYQLGGALGLAIGQSLLLPELRKAVSELAGAIPPDLVMAVGPTGLDKLAPEPAILSALRQAYAQSVRPPLILAVAAVCFAFAPSCMMEWRNIKKVAAERVRLEKEGKDAVEMAETTGPEV
ncbi:Major facilitator superfamily domain containing protein [Rhypophila decipiens]